MSFNPHPYDDVVDPEPQPVDEVLAFLQRNLERAINDDKATRAHLSEMQAKAAAMIRERKAIERAINAYQGGAE